MLLFLSYDWLLLPGFFCFAGIRVADFRDIEQKTLKKLFVFSVL